MLPFDPKLRLCGVFLLVVTQSSKEKVRVGAEHPSQPVGIWMLGAGLAGQWSAWELRLCGEVLELCRAKNGLASLLLPCRS